MKQLIIALTLLLSLPTFARVTTNERALIIISELDSGGIPELRPLYTALEYLTQVTVRRVISNRYSRIVMLDNTKATFKNFRDEVKLTAARNDIKAIDVILSLHGSRNYLSWKDRRMSVGEMERLFLSTATAAERRKLRSMYNLSCYGLSHNPSFIRMGFDVATGSVAINANSETEFVPFLKAWKGGASFKSSFWASNNAAALYLADEPVRELGRRENNSLQDTNSKKIFQGLHQLKITADPRP